MNDQKFCQSCAMPLAKPEDHGTNADGSKNDDYCSYCYADGKFTNETTMDGMIEVCVPFCLQAGVYKSEDEARASMKAFFPQLKRWAKAQ